MPTIPRIIWFVFSLLSLSYFLSLLFCVISLFFSKIPHFFYEGGEEGVVTGLSFAGLFCEDSLFLNGIAVQQTWFQVLYHS